MSGRGSSPDPLEQIEHQAVDAVRSGHIGPFRKTSVLAWPRQILIDGQPADVYDTIAANGRFLAATLIPKLFINVEPGMAITDRERSFVRTFPNQTRGHGQRPAFRAGGLGGGDRRRDRQVVERL
jgi:hypothetical protein